MVYGAINEKNEAWYTRMSRVFDAIENRQILYNWLITDMDGVPAGLERLCGGKSYCWLTGEELTELVRREDEQWVWAVLSGFSKEVPKEQVLQHPLPYADGYEGFWKMPLSIQHPLAQLEIVPWDSSLTLFLSRQPELVEHFRRFFPFSEDLGEYNQPSE